MLFLNVIYIIEINEPHEGLRKNESQWPIHQINWQKTRYVFDLYYTYHRISKEVYNYCIDNKIIDALLAAKWKKPGYERLCSTYVINPRNYKFGTVSICRVPKASLGEGLVIEDPMTGCRGCASGPGGNKNIFGNKYGQYLAAIQIARELKAMNETNSDDEDNDDTYHEERDERSQRSFNPTAYLGPVGAADGSSGAKVSIWADNEEEEIIPEDYLGSVDEKAEEEALKATRHSWKDNSRDEIPQYKRPRNE